jgi:hypothetical protein
MQFSEDRLRKIIREEIMFRRSKALNESILELELLTEGIYDPGILKAVFMAGGPGSGKSYTAGAVFGGNAIEGATQQASTALGLRIINSDPAFEMYLRQVGVDPGDLANLSDEEFKALTIPADSPRGKASKMKKTQQAAAQVGRLGMIIDGTGDELAKLTAKKEAVEALGYDTFMVFVNTTLEMAQERNMKRDRKLPKDLVEKIWTNVQDNKGDFEELFGSNMVIIDNTEYEWSAAEQQAASAAVNFVQSPVQNPIGHEWARDALVAKGADPEDPWVQKQLKKITG